MHKRFLTYDKHNPPAGVNAAGMMSCDVVAHVVEDFKNTTNSQPVRTVKLIHGSYAELLAKIAAKKPVSGYIVTERIYAENTEYMQVSIDAVKWASDGEEISLSGGTALLYEDNGYSVTVFADGTVD